MHVSKWSSSSVFAFFCAVYAYIPLLFVSSSTSLVPTGINVCPAAEIRDCTVCSIQSDRNIIGV